MTARALTVSALAGLLATLAACTPPAPPARALPAAYVTAVTLDAPSLARRFSAVVAARVESEVGFRTGGKVVERLVGIGQTVKRGQALARLDPNDLSLGVDAAMEQLKAAEVDARQAASDAARFARLAADESIPAADAERQRARADAADARLLQARRQVELARNRVTYATLTAPFDGVVTTVRVEPGQVVAEGQPALAIARAGELELAVDIPEALADGLPAQRATAVDGRGQPVALRLRELAPSAQPVTRTYRARYVPADGPAEGWRLGMTAAVHLASPGAQAPVAALPIGAIVRSTGAPQVWTVADPATGTLAARTVEVVDQSADRVWVRGLQAGELVVTAGAHKLDAGLRVRPVARPLDPPLQPAAAAATLSLTHGATR